MRKSVFIYFAACLLVSCASGHEKQFDTSLPEIRSLESYTETLLSYVESNPRLEAKVIGVVEYRNFRAELYAVIFTPPGEALHTVLVTGGVHGNEPAGADFTLSLVQTLADESTDFRSTSFEIIPIVNLWGWVHDSRFNYNGKDINRDFSSFETQEAAIVKNYLSGRSFDFVIDHHEDPHAKGVYLYQYGNRDTSAARRVLTEVKTLGYPLEEEVNMIILKTDNGLIEAPMWGLRYMRVTGQLSITNYARLKLSDIVYTVETPVNLPIAERIKIHRLIFAGLAEHAGMISVSFIKE